MDGVIRVVIADDHAVVRQGLRFVLEQEPGIEVAGEAADGVAAVAETLRHRPDVLLLDMRMPGLDGLGVLLQLSTMDVRPAVVVLTSYADEGRALDAVRAGAMSYLPKTASTDRVVEAVRAAAAGGSILDPGVTATLVHRLRSAAGESPLNRLSTRERDVLAELSRGRSNREIARLLSLGEQTVKSYVSSILTKLDLQDRTQAAIFGLQHGIVPLGDALDPDRQ
ncbi:MAG TPA: response regulator transcription factor [Dactylosporangium sp.]|nr:response regulator transcription factor [Dactylosporangium sp.]